jgi:PPK2 family polyphosphate:nucleotide phosphotransferase
MNYRRKFLVEAGGKLRLARIDPSFTGKIDHDKARKATAKEIERIVALQYLLYADAGKSLLIVLQGLDAGGKDGVIQHLFSGMNPQGVTVASFKEPSKEEAAHDFLWRVHVHAPGRGKVVIFNRSHYEDVLVPRVHNLVPKAVWSKRYEQINGFETLLAGNNTRILKFFLHISPAEQLERFKARLDDPNRRWKISESDYTEREFWPQYMQAYEDILARTSTKDAPWFVIPSNHKWFRNLAISRIVADTMEDMGLALPKPHVDLAEIRRHYEAAERAQRKGFPTMTGKRRG